MPGPGLKSMGVLHLRVLSWGQSLERLGSEAEGEREREIDGGKEEEGGNALVTTDLHNYPVLLPESKCDQTGIIAHWKRR